MFTTLTVFPVAVLLIFTAVAATSSLPVQHTFDVGLDTGKSYITNPGLCNDGTKQYSGYLPGSPLFFWFFESRSEPKSDPIGLWLNGGPGSSSLEGMDLIGPCSVVVGDDGAPRMQERSWSWNRNFSILVIDNPKGTGFSRHPFPASHSTYLAATDLYDFLQSFLRTFPEYAQQELALNSLSYGGHYAPVYSAYILHRNALLSGKETLFADVWHEYLEKDTITLNLRSISIGNGWFATYAQIKSLVDFACGGAEGVPVMLTESECDWSYQQWEKCEVMLKDCDGIYVGPQCAAAGLFCENAVGYHYNAHGYNPYDWRTKTPYMDGLLDQFYNNISTQIALGVVPASTSAPVKWNMQSEGIHLEFKMSGDFYSRTDYLLERILRSGVDVLKYEGIVDYICNFLGVRHVMSNLPAYAHQDAFNSLKYMPWAPFGEQAGAYKCLRGNGSEGLLCYLEIEDAGHIVAANKPKEAAWMIANWVTGRTPGSLDVGVELTTNHLHEVEAVSFFF